MSTLVRSAGVSRRIQTKRKFNRGYAKSRMDYDRRRRSAPLDGLGRTFKAIVQCDPCAFCSAPATDADHVDPLELGGANVWENLGGVCHSCNASKRNDPLLLAMLRMRDGR